MPSETNNQDGYAKNVICPLFDPMEIKGISKGHLRVRPLDDP